MFQWSKKDAENLKIKLEFHQGTPEELAAEARKLATKVQPSQPINTWRLPTDSQAVSLATSMLGSSLRAALPPIPTEGGLQGSSLSQSDIEMADSPPGYI